MLPTYIIFLALLTRVTDVSGETRVLLTFDCTNNTHPEEDNTKKYGETKLNMYSLVKMAAAKDGLVNLRGETTNDDLFTTFVNYCLIHMTTSVQ